MKKITIFLSIFIITVILNSASLAQTGNNIARRFGIGINNNLTPLSINSDHPNTQISIRYWLDKLRGFETALGFCFEDSNNNDFNSFTLGGKFLYTIRQQKNSNFYLAPITGITFYDSNDNGTGFLIGCVGGSEFFFDQLPYLRFNLEAGIAYKTIDDNSSFTIIGDTLGWAGFHYYL